jgi:hypothetical protein
VQLRGEPGLAWRAAILVLPALAAGGGAAWALGLTSPTGAGAAAVLGAALLGAGGAALAERHAALGAAHWIEWNGRTWRVERAGSGAAPAGGGASGGLRVVLDAGAFMLLRFEGGSGHRAWVAVRRIPGAPWRALRAALHSPPGATLVPPAAADAAATPRS